MNLQTSLFFFSLSTVLLGALLIALDTERKTKKLEADTTKAFEFLHRKILAVEINLINTGIIPGSHGKAEENGK